MSKLTGAALDRAVANAMGLKSVNDCEKWGTSHQEEIKTQLAPAPWPQVKRPAEKKVPSDKRIDAKFKEWVAKNNIDPREYPVLKGVKS